MKKTKEVLQNERTENMKEKETKNKTACHPGEPCPEPCFRVVSGSYQSTKEKEILNSVQSLQSQRVMLQNDKESSRHPERSEGSVNRFFGTSCLRMTGRSAAFTLAETLIALVILGIVAAITVPQLARKYVERANRTKFKKAVTSYESLMNKIAIMNDLKSNGAIQSWATKDNTISDCSIAYNYFKAVKDLSTDSKCKFKTADGVYWDITDLQKPIISIKEADLTDAVAKSDTNRAFYLYAQYDGTGILRVTEPNFNYTLTSDKTEVDASVDRLWAYLNGKAKMTTEEVDTATSEPTYSFESEYQKALNGEYSDECGEDKKGCIVFLYDFDYKMYDSEGNLIAHGHDCDSEDLPGHRYFRGVGECGEEYAFQKTEEGKIIQCTMHMDYKNFCWEPSDISAICYDIGEDTCIEAGIKAGGQ